MKTQLYPLIFAVVFASFVTTVSGQPTRSVPANSFSASRNIAILVGVGQYADPRWDKLTSPTKEMDILKKKLVADWNFSPKNVFVRKDVTSRYFMAFMDSLSNAVTPSDNVLLYFSLHGSVQNGNSFYFHFQNSMVDDETTWTPAWLLVNKIKETIKSDKLLMLTDACFSGSLIELVRQRGRPVNVESVEIFKKYPSAEIITAGDSFSPVPDESQFFAALIQTLDNWEHRDLPAGRLKDEIFDVMAIRRSSSRPLYGFLPMIHVPQGGSFVLEKRTGRINPTPDVPVPPPYEPEPVDPPLPAAAEVVLSKGVLFHNIRTTNRNEEFEISATGQITVGQYLREVTPDGRAKGLFGFSIADYNIVPSINHAGLMFRVSGSDPWKFCGSNCIVKFIKPGLHRLELRVNDNNEGDNSGSFKISIRKK
ncbi:caspase family protein [Dyadobacter diqingensis]|uniref:caspase family protein n=1 Tax=Dyadobacter diqingensis TaxID=2938121 RepID=UPI0020C1A460|nr:caspase family protein [Dyadobacter diqingensis]